MHIAVLGLLPAVRPNGHLLLQDLLLDIPGGCVLKWKELGHLVVCRCALLLCPIKEIRLVLHRRQLNMEGGRHTTHTVNEVVHFQIIDVLLTNR